MENTTPAAHPEALEGPKNPCRHHWLLDQPQDGAIPGVCRDCGTKRSFPAYLDEYDWTVANERRYTSIGVATAAGGARPSSGALLGEYES